MTIIFFAGWFKINNTFTTSVSVSVPLPSKGVKYKCEASGVAIGDSEDNHVTVTIRHQRQAGNNNYSNIVIKITENFTPKFRIEIHH